jgi:phage shock protein C
MEYKRLYRSSKDVKLGGVAAGLAEYFNIDPTIVRLLFLLLFVPSGGAVVPIYFILWMVVPRNPGA